MPNKPVYLFLKPAPVDYMTEVYQIMRKDLDSFTVLDMVEKHQGKLDPDPRFIRPDLGRITKVRSFVLEYLGSLLQNIVKPTGGIVVGIDGAYENFSSRVEEAAKLGDIKMAFGSAMSANFPELLRIFYHLSKEGITCVAGGIHPSLRPKDIERYLNGFLPKGAPKVTVVVGPGDNETFTQIINDHKKGRLESYYYGKKGLEKGGWIPKNRITKGRFLMRSVEVSRGCPYRCSFCSISGLPGSLRKVQRLPMDDVIAQLLDSKRWDPFPESRTKFIISENIYMDKKYVKYLLKEILDKNINISFISQAAVTIAGDREYLKLLRDAGCNNLLIGFESLDERNLKSIGKYPAFKMIRKLGANSVEEGYAEAIKIIQGHGISIMGAFVLGLPHDNDDTGKRIGEFIGRNHLIPHPSALTALPGAELFEKTYRDKLLYGHPDDYNGIHNNPYPAAFSGMDLTEINLYPENVSSPAHIQTMLHDVLDQVLNSKNKFLSFSNIFLDALLRGRKRRPLQTVFDSLTASALELSMFKICEDLERRINRGTDDCMGALDRLRMFNRTPS